MAPNVARTDLERHRTRTIEAGAPVEKSQQVALLDEDAQQLRSMLRDLRQKIIENSTDVGDQFADQAQRMHDGDIPHRAIRGETTAEQARALLDNGVPIMPIPSLPDEQN